MFNRSSIAALLSFAVATLVAGTAAAETIKVGVAGPYSGDLAPYGLPVKQAVELAVNEINSHGGIDGKMLEIVAEDDACDPNTAANVADKLIGAGVDFVIGHICSGATNAALPKYKNAGILVISPSATNPDLTLAGKYPNFFRTIAHDLKQAELLVNFATKKLSVKKAAVIHDKQDYGKGLAEGIKANLEKAGVEVALFEGITAGATEYSALISKLKQAGVDQPDTAVFYGGYHTEGSKILSGARRSGNQAKFLGGDGLKDPTFLETAKNFSLYFYASAPADTSMLPSAISFVEQYKQEFNEDVGVFSLAGYAAVQVVSAALKATGTSTDLSKLSSELTSSTVSTAIGDISFDQKGDVVGTGFAIYQVRPGFVKADF